TRHLLIMCRVEYPPSPEFIPEPVYQEFMLTEDDILPAEEQPLPAAALPATEGYLAPDDSIAVALPAIDHAPSAEETEPFETDESAATPPPHPAYRVTAKMFIKPQTPISLASDIEIPRQEIPEADLPLRKRLCTAHTGTYELGVSSAAIAVRLREPVRDDLYMFVDTVERGEGYTPAAMEVGYGITNTWDDLVGAIQETAPTTMEGVSQRVTKLSTTFDRETSMIYAMIEENRMTRVYKEPESTGYSGIGDSMLTMLDSWREKPGLLVRLRHTDYRFQTTVRTQQEEIRELRAAHRKLQAQFIQALTALKSCQTQLTVALGRIQILEAARVPAQPEKMAPKRSTRANPATTTTTTTTFVPDAQLEALLEQGVAKALAARDADRNTNDDDNHVSGTGARRTKRVTRECIYPDFMKCKPLNFKDLKKRMTDKYRPRGEMKKLESELWNLRVKSNDVVSYNQRFQILALLCVRMFPEEADKIERYVSGLPDVIHKSVVASRPKMMQEATKMANELMDKRNNTWAKRQAENKRKVDDTSRNNQSQHQQQNNRRNTGRAYTAGSGEKKPYGGSKSLSTTNVNTANNQRGNGTGQKPTCYECGSQGHFRKDFLKFKKNNRGTQGGNATAPAKVYAIGRAGTNPDSNVVTEDYSHSLRNEILIVHGDGSGQGNETRLNIISYAKTQKYIQKGCHVFLSHITMKETEDKSEKKRLEDVPIVQNFPEVFPEDLPGLPPTRQV
nr:hypothetical protein [Tanacetum cinerariifolium]